MHQRRTMIAPDGNNNDNHKSGSNNGTMNIWAFAAKLWVFTALLGLSTFVFLRTRSYREAVQDWHLDGNQKENNVNLRVVGRLDSSIFELESENQEEESPLDVP